MSDFYKIENNSLIKFKDKYIVHNETVYSNPTEEHLRSAGWKTLILTEKPEDEPMYYYEAYYEEDDDNIVQKWEKKEIILDYTE